MNRLEGKVEAIGEEVVTLRKARTELQERVSGQFSQQIKQLRRIFETDVQAR